MTHDLERKAQSMDADTATKLGRLLRSIQDHYVTLRLHGGSSVSGTLVAAAFADSRVWRVGSVYVPVSAIVAVEVEE